LISEKEVCSKFKGVNPALTESQTRKHTGELINTQYSPSYSLHDRGTVASFAALGGKNKTETKRGSKLK
jgi:hypothetical protein